MQFDVDARGNAIVNYNFDGEIKTVNLGGGAMTFSVYMDRQTVQVHQMRFLSQLHCGRNTPL